MPNIESKILASDVNSLFNRLNEIRIAHNNSGQSAEGQAALSQEFNTAPAVEGKKILAQTDGDNNGVMPLMKQYINTLRKSVYLTALTDEQINKIKVPNVGDLIKYQEYADVEQLVTIIESYPSSYTTNYSGFNSGNFNHNGNDFTNFSNNGSDFSHFSFDGSDFTNFSFNGSDFTNFNFSSTPTTPHTNQRFDGRFFRN